MRFSDARLAPDDEHDREPAEGGVGGAVAEETGEEDVDRGHAAVESMSSP